MSGDLIEPNPALAEADKGLRWYPQLGLGYVEVPPPGPYDAAYFAKYLSYSTTDLGHQLTAFRCDWVEQHYDSGIVDIGAAACAFLLARNRRDYHTDRGYDIMPPAVELLRTQGWYVDPYKLTSIEAITMWDSFEHIRNPLDLLSRVTKWVFMSLPVFRDPAAVFESRHYRTDEHFWYFTTKGLEMFMFRAGFTLVAHSSGESKIGRDQILTAAFQRATGDRDDAGDGG